MYLCGSNRKTLLGTPTRKTHSKKPTRNTHSKKPTRNTHSKKPTRNTHSKKPTRKPTRGFPSGLGKPHENPTFSPTRENPLYKSTSGCREHSTRFPGYISLHTFQNIFCIPFKIYCIAYIYCIPVPIKKKKIAYLFLDSRKKG